VAYGLAARATFPAMRLSASLFSTQQVREVTAFSMYLFLISIAIHVGVNVDNLIVGAYLGTSAIAVYTVAVRLAEYQRQLCGQFSGFLFPLVVRFHSSQDSEALRTTLLDGTRIAVGLVAGVTICLLAFGGQIVRLWMGPGFDGSVVPLYVLSLVGIVMVAQGPTGSILLATGRHRLVAGASVADIALNVALSAALVTKYGLMGVAIGTALPYTILNLAILVPAACRAVEVPLGAFAATVTTPALVASLPAVAVAALLRATTAPGSLVAVVTQGALVGLVYVAAFCAVGLPAPDRARYFGSLRRVALGTG
jgi:O-antigen/teichoic acid export membrane protein